MGLFNLILFVVRWLTMMEFSGRSRLLVGGGAVVAGAAALIALNGPKDRHASKNSLSELEVSRREAALHAESEVYPHRSQEEPQGYPQEARSLNETLSEDQHIRNKMQDVLEAALGNQGSFQALSELLRHSEAWIALGEDHVMVVLPSDVAGLEDGVQGFIEIKQSFSPDGRKLLHISTVALERESLSVQLIERVGNEHAAKLGALLNELEELGPEGYAADFSVAEVPNYLAFSQNSGTAAQDFQLLTEAWFNEAGLPGREKNLPSRINYLPDGSRYETYRVDGKFHEGRGEQIIDSQGQRKAVVLYDGAGNPRLVQVASEADAIYYRDLLPEGVTTEIGIED